MLELLQIISAYIIADAIAAIYHLVTDLGYNIPKQVAFFRKHHEQPWTMTFDLQPLLGGIPIIILGLFIYPWFFISLGISLCIAQIPHYYSHHRDNTPRIISFLQKYKIILSPASHDNHHYGNGLFDRDFCVLSGWNNFWLNPIAKYLQRFKR